MFQPSLVPAAPIAERLRAGVGRRAYAIGLALLIEALLLLLLLSFSAEDRPEKQVKVVTVTDLEANEVAQESPEPNSPGPEQQADGQPCRGRERRTCSPRDPPNHFRRSLLSRARRR